MKKIFSFFLLMSSCAIFAMGTEEGEIKQLIYPSGDSLTFTINERELSKHVVPADKANVYVGKMNDMRNLLSKSEIVQHALEQFQSVLVKETKPWEDEQRMIKAGVKELVDVHSKKLADLSRDIQAMERADRTKLFPIVYVEGMDPEFENTMSWNSALAEKKEVLKKFVAAQIVSSLLQLEEIEEAHAKVREKTAGAVNL